MNPTDDARLVADTAWCAAARARLARYAHPESVVCWDFDDGWLPLAVRLLDDVLAIDPDIRFIDAKQKWGLLTIDPAPSDHLSDTDAAEIDRLIGTAQVASASICEITGEPGLLVSTKAGWIKALSLPLVPEGARALMPSRLAELIPEPWAQPVARLVSTEQLRVRDLAQRLDEVRIATWGLADALNDLPIDALVMELFAGHGSDFLTALYEATGVTPPGLLDDGAADDDVF